MEDLTNHSNEGLNLSLIAFKEEEIRKIYINKVIYSILKYNMQDENVKEFFKDKYEYVKNLHRGDFANGDIEEVKRILEEELVKYKKTAEINQKVIDFITPTVIGNFKSGCKKEYSEVQRFKYLLEYVTNTFRYNYDSKKYNYAIPFGTEYSFEFSNNVPVGDFKELLITKEVLGDELASLIKYLGEQIGLYVETVLCDFNGERRLINAAILHKQIDDETYDKFNYEISYIDALSVLQGAKVKEDAFLLSRLALNKNDEYSNFTFVNQNIDESKNDGTSIIYDDIVIDDIKEVVRIDNLLVNIEYVANDVFKQK